MSLKDRIKQKKLEKQLAQLENAVEATQEYSTVKQELSSYLYENVTSTIFFEKCSEYEKKELLREMIEKHLKTNYDDVFFSNIEKEKLILDLIQETKVFGPLSQFIEDDKISTILVNSFNEIFIEKNSKLYKTSVAFKDEKHFQNTIDKIIAKLNYDIEDDEKIIAAKMQDGTKVTIVLQPVAKDGCYMAIKKLNRNFCDFNSLYNSNFLSRELVEFILYSLSNKANILITGAALTGKTTLLNAMCHKLPQNERLVVIQKSNELEFEHLHCLNLEVASEINMNFSTVKKAARLYPDRIILGELNNIEIYDFLNLSQSGISGLVSTLEALTPCNALEKMKHMLLESQNLILDNMIDELIAENIDLIINVARNSKNQLYVESVSTPILNDNLLELEQVIIFDNGIYKNTGIVPDFVNLNDLEEYDLSSDFFNNSFEHTNIETWHKEQLNSQDKNNEFENLDSIVEQDKIFKKNKKSSISNRFKNNSL